jgi:hypothetical protein
MAPAGDLFSRYVQGFRAVEAPQAEIRPGPRIERHLRAASGAPSTGLENPKRLIRYLPSVLTTASGLQGEQPLAGRTM